MKAALWGCEAQQKAVSKRQVLRKEPGPQEDGRPRSCCCTCCLCSRKSRSKTEIFSGKKWDGTGFTPSLV